MSGKATKLTVNEELLSILRNRLEDEGWDSIRNFTISNQKTMCISVETTRRVFGFMTTDHKGIEAYTLANVMLHLNFSRTQIRDALKQYTNDNLMWRLIGGEDERAGLYAQEECLINMLRIIETKSQDIYYIIANLVSTISQSLNIDVSDYVKRISKYTERKKQKGGVVNGSI